VSRYHGAESRTYAPSGQQIPGHVSVFRRHIMVTKPVSTLSRYRGRRRRPGRRVSSRPDILDVYKTATTTTTTTEEINNYRKPKRTTVGPVGPPTTAVVSATLRSFVICRAMQLSLCIEAIGVRNLNQTNGRSVRLTALMIPALLLNILHHILKEYVCLCGGASVRNMRTEFRQSVRPPRPQTRYTELIHKTRTRNDSDVIIRMLYRNTY